MTLTIPIRRSSTEMVFKGQAPKDDSERLRKNNPLYDRLPVKWDGKIRGPGLPKDREWCDATKAWWAMFRRSPQSMVCATTDWQFLLDTALLYDRMWNPNISDTNLKALSAEFRIRMSSYGYIWEDRLKLRMEIDSPITEANIEAAAKADAQKAVDYLSRMNKYAAEDTD